MSIQGAPGSRRRRRTPEVAQAEIIAAAEALLRERPFRELTVDEVMRRTELSRPSFYVYFRDRHELVLRVVEQLTLRIFETGAAWFEGTGADLLAQGLERALTTYADHGPVIRALADAAMENPEVEAAYFGMMQTFIDAVADQIREEIDRGEIVPLDPVAVASSLIWGAERYCYISMGREPETPLEVVIETLQTIWLRTLYGSRRAAAT